MDQKGKKTQIGDRQGQKNSDRQGQYKEGHAGQERNNKIQTKTKDKAKHGLLWTIMDKHGQRRVQQSRDQCDKKGQW